MHLFVETKSEKRKRLMPPLALDDHKVLF